MKIEWKIKETWQNPEKKIRRWKKNEKERRRKEEERRREQKKVGRNKVEVEDRKMNKE